MRLPSALRFTVSSLRARCGLIVLLALCCSWTRGQAQTGQEKTGQENGAPGEEPGGASGPPRQGPSFGPGYPGSRMGNVPSTQEYAAYSAAVRRTPASAQAAALESFLTTFPQSTLAPQARRWLNIAGMQAGQPSAEIPAAAVAAAPAGAAVRGPSVSGSPVAGAGTPTQQVVPRPVSRVTPGATLASRRAVVDLGAHVLTIRADNSSLTQILRDLTTSSGMKVEGLSRDERIYGSFGPGEPQEVLALLVSGLGYNVMMVGESSGGVPRQLILSPRPQESGQSVAAEARQPGDSDQDEEVIQDDLPAALDIQQGPGRPLMPPQSAPGPGSNSRTTEQMLEELRRLHPQGEMPPPEPPQ